MDLTEKTLESQRLFTGRIINLCLDKALLPDGSVANRELVQHPGGVSVAALTENNEIYMVRQFRYPYQQVLLELPAGKLEKGEDPFEAVKREQKEETGTIGQSYQYLGDIYPTPGYVDEIIRLWACRVSGKGSMHLDDHEFLEVEKVPLQQAVSMVLQNQIPDAKTQIGILKTYFLVQKGAL